MRITTEMISDVVWSDMLDSDDYEGIAQSINMREGVGVANANDVKDLIQHETVDTPDIETIIQMNNLKINY
jgi:hypothetical protein